MLVIPRCFCFFFLQSSRQCPWRSLECVQFVSVLVHIFCSWHCSCCCCCSMRSSSLSTQWCVNMNFYAEHAPLLFIHTCASNHLLYIPRMCECVHIYKYISRGACILVCNVRKKSHSCKCSFSRCCWLVCISARFSGIKIIYSCVCGGVSALATWLLNWISKCNAGVKTV